MLKKLRFYLDTKSHYLPESLAPGGPYSENGHRFLEQILGKSLMEINGN